MNDERFGVGKVIGIRRCSMYSCKNIATIYIGDTNQQHAIKNFFLCDDHAEAVLNKLLEIYNVKPQATNPDLNAQTSQDSAIGQETKDKYLKLLYSNSGMLPKAKLVEFCEKNGIKAPKEDMNTKKYMELIFPELLKEDSNK